MQIRRIKEVIAVVVTACVISGCGQRGEYRQAEGVTWGTTYHITYFSDKDLSDSIVSVMRCIDMSLSAFEPTSQISRINAGETVKADSMLRHVLRLSQEVHRMSGGAFDPTLAPLINLWGFGYREGGGSAPSDSAIARCMQTVGIAGCGIAEDGTLIKKHPDTEFNFSAIAKGYGVDCVSQMLRRNGCTDYMVEIGGEVALSGDGPRGEGWVIQIDAPVYDKTGQVHEQMRLIHSTDIGIATSGSYRNYRDTPEGRISHTISAVTGRPIDTGTVSATVTAPTTALADALATAVMAMQPDSALAMIEGVSGCEALIVVDRGNLQVIETSAFGK